MDSKYAKKAGIYKLTCTNNGKVYIGKSINLSKRLNSHKNSFKKTRGLCYLHHAIIKHGWNSFKIDILETFDDFDKMEDNKKLLNRESYYIQLFQSTNPDIGYNICKYSNDVTGKKLTIEHKEKISNSLKGREFKKSHRENLSESAKGKIMSKDAREKMSNAKKGKVSHRKGVELSEETKEKISKAKSGKPSNRRGVKLSKETKEKMKNSHLKIKNTTQ